MSASNSYRLGANEAPPPSSLAFWVHNSSTLDEIVRQVGNEKMTPEEKTTLKLGIGRIPEILLDTTDRNRTSPFAFTGNRFEFRAAGSSSNCAASMIAINAAMANQLNEFRASVEKLMEEGVGKDEAILPPAERNNYRLRTDSFRRGRLFRRMETRSRTPRTD